MSWAPEVIADSSGKWAGNATRFATKEEAEIAVQDLASRWMLVTDTRVVESEDPVNYRIHNHRLERLPRTVEGTGTCKHCGSDDIVGRDTIMATAYIQGWTKVDGTLEPDYAGYTDVDWNTQQPEDDKLPYQCSKCDEKLSDSDIVFTPTEEK